MPGPLFLFYIFYPMLDISIIVITYNSESEISACLTAAASASSGSEEIVVVDNNSSDSTCYIVSRDFPAVKLISNNDNRGFAAAVNTGAAKTKGKYLLILNPDVRITSAALSAMQVSLDKHANYAAVGCEMKLLNGDRQLSARPFPTVTSFLVRSVRTNSIARRFANRSAPTPDARALEALTPVDWILGGCALIRRSAFNQIGCFDEKYFLYYEDIDWCYRARLKDWKIGFYRGVSVVHAYKRSSSRVSIRNPLLWIHLKSASRFFVKFAKNRGLRTIA